MRIVFALLALAALTRGAVADETCGGDASDLQALRDNLEVVRTQLASAKDNFGPGRGQALDATTQAIAALEGAAGHALAPSPGTNIVRTPGRTHHPRMTIAQGALQAAHRHFERAKCLLADRGAGVQRALAAIDAGVADAINANPPGSGG